MKAIYEAPVQEIITFEEKDIITTSTTDRTTLPPMNNAGEGGGIGTGDRIDINELLGRN